MDYRQKSRRIKALQKILSDGLIDAAILILSRDLFYYTGTAQPCFLLVTQDDYRILSIPMTEEVVVVPLP
jgi:Xaa-Pro aminopeptidase